MPELLEEVKKIVGVNTVGGHRAVTEKGLPSKSLKMILKRTSLSQEVVLSGLKLKKRTIARRVEKKEDFSAEESERMLRLAISFANAVDVLGSPEKATKWLVEPNDSLGGQAPISVLNTGFGLEEVLHILGRIEYGVYS